MRRPDPLLDHGARGLDRLVEPRDHRHPWAEHLGLVCRDPERHADRVEFAYVDEAAHFITDDAPAEVADLALDWFERAA